MANWTTRQVIEAAKKGGRPVTQEYVRRLCAGGVIKAEKPGRDWLIPEQEARRWLTDWLNKGNGPRQS